MSKQQTLDMTKGNPLPILIKFAIPLVLGSIFQQLYSFVDTAIVGRCISVDALSAVGITGALNFLVLGLTMACVICFKETCCTGNGIQCKCPGGLCYGNCW